MEGYVCPEHPGGSVVEDHAAGDLICQECGRILGDRVVDVGTEWRTFSNSNDKGAREDPNRVGPAINPLLNGQQVASMLGPAPGQGSSLAAMNIANRESADRSLSAAFRRIRTMASRIQLKEIVVQRAMKLFKETVESKRLRGRSHEAVAAACIYLACRLENAPRTFKEICPITEAPKRDIGRVCNLITAALNLGAAQASSSDYMGRFCSRLRLSQATQMAASTVAQRATNDFDVVAGKVPISVAAAAIYLAALVSNENPSLAEISDATGVAEATIRTSYREMYPIKEYLLPMNFASKSLASMPNPGEPLSGGINALAKVQLFYERQGLPMPPPCNAPA